jgi:hypothetical protein
LTGAYIREDEREMLAWNPMQDDTIYSISIDLHSGSEGTVQRLVLNPTVQGGSV